MSRMIAPAALAALLAGSPVAVEPIGEDRFRLSIFYSGRDAAAHSDAQIELAGEAQRVCRGRGRARLGAVEISRVPGENGRGTRAALSRTVACGGEASAR